MNKYSSRTLRILILGGRGFVGRAICARLQNHSVYTFDRHSGGKQHIQGGITSLPDVQRACRNKEVVINLIGLTPLKQPRGATYSAVHITGVKNVITACEQNTVKRMIHMSVLGADKKAKTAFLRTRGEGEALVLASRLKVTVFCPSLIYDKENELLRQLHIMKRIRFFPNIPAKIQPVYRQDVARLFQLAVEGKIRERKLEVGGPEVMSIYSFAKQYYNSSGFSCYPVPFLLFKLLFSAATLLPFSKIGQDQVTSLSLDNVTKQSKAKTYLKFTTYADWLKQANT